VSGIAPPKGIPVPKILVADDNANIQKMVALSFEDRGISVVAVGNGEAAVRRIPDLKPDLVLADIFMPVRNGYEVCEFVKKDERFSHVPVILLVGAFDPLDEKEARRVGADGVLKKPFVPPDPLIAMVMSALEKNPKVAAELAKAREVKEAPPLPAIESVPEPATSVRAELKPLPDFPEPTPEEAALVYGFGTGRRALDDSPLEAEALDEPKQPVAEDDEAAEEEFDGASTTRDWRRNAMEIDIPPEAANKSAFLIDDEPDSSVFPSERDVPPRRVPFTEHVEEVQSAEAATPAPAEPPPTEPSFAKTLHSDFFRPPAVEAEPPPAPLEPEPAPAPEPASESAPSHWMDQLAQGSSAHPATDWMSILSEQTAQGMPFVAPEPERNELIASPAEPVEAASEAPVNSGTRTTPESEATHPEPSHDSFFADEVAPSSSWSSPVEHSRDLSAEPAPEAIKIPADQPLPVPASKTEESFEPYSEPESPVSYRDPELDLPSAVHVTPEPLLVRDEPQATPAYGAAHEQDVAPMHSFLAPASAAPPIEEPPVAESPETDGVAFGTEPAEAEVSERIPTGPPPSREALAEIPFLTPPPEFLAQPQEQAAANPETVDAVVQKVLQKLEPRLHDLLSQGVLKPLVENLLQSEMTKKEE
jgi:CheY-like chemotaxis protein